MNRPDAATRRDDLDKGPHRPRLTPRPDGGGGDSEPIAEILEEADEDHPRHPEPPDAERPPSSDTGRPKPRTLRDILPGPRPEDMPEGDGAQTPPIAP